MTAVLEARALAKTYNSGGVDVLALRGVDLEIGAGEFVAVMGPSGCGKSTFLHLLGGLDRPTAGQVILEGDRLDNLSETGRAMLRRRQIGFVFQFFNLIPNLTAAENVELAARVAGASKADARKRREELFARLGLTERADTLPAHLSGGQQQRVALARALVNHPAIVFADEPTGNLDTESAQEVLGLLRAARDEGQTIVLVTHDARVAAHADRIVSLRDGLVADEVHLSAARNSADILPRLVDLEGWR
jgi:putative ABC transport system ATP-binding protein